MATWVIGDIQGCRDELDRLLVAVAFDPAVDRLWLAGDLVNRGPDSVGCLRLARDLGEAVVAVLGNHDLHLLAMAQGLREPRERDTARAVLDAPDADELLTWLRHRPLLHREGRTALVHAGLAPPWTLAEGEVEARAAERMLSGESSSELLRALPSAPARWDDALTGVERAACAVSFLTRVRTCLPDGAADHAFSGAPADAPLGRVPWFELSRAVGRGDTLVFAHWAALGLLVRPDLLALDTGCVWGGTLTALRLEDRRVVDVECGTKA